MSHIHDHVRESCHGALDALVQPIPIGEVIHRLGVPESTFIYRKKRIVDDLYLEGSQWRVTLVRLYYGIDPCWCQEAA